MSARTKKDHRKALACLKPTDLSYPAADPTTADMYHLRDATALAHWNKLADSLMSCLSGAFTKGVNRNLVPGNPVCSVEKLQIDDPNANHEWRLDEFETVMRNAPSYLSRPYAIARYAGLRGQDIVKPQTSD